MNRLIWVLQVLFGVYFVAIGVMHFTLPAGLPEPMGWMYELSTTLHVASGIAEIAGGLGLILPAATRIKPHLTPLAAAGLAVVMILASVWHLPRGETQTIVVNLVLAGLLASIAYFRWRIRPVVSRNA